LISTVIACRYAIAAVPVAARLNHEIVMPCRNGAKPPVQSGPMSKNASFLVIPGAICSRLNLAKPGELLLKGYCAGFGRKYLHTIGWRFRTVNYGRCGSKVSYGVTLSCTSRLK
jgi:hypothetical protein